MFFTVLIAVFTLGFFLGNSRPAPEATITIVEKRISPLPAVQNPSTTDESAFPVNLNTATKAQLMTLPGIGDVLAQRILDYRTAAGAFARVTDLMLVEGIGEKRMEELLEYITVGG